MPTFADLDGIKTYLADAIRAEDGIADDVVVYVDKGLDELGTLSLPFIAIEMGPTLDAPADAQTISAGRKLGMDGDVLISIGFHAMDKAAAVSMRDGVIQRVCLATMQDRRLGDRVRFSWVSRIERLDEKKGAGFVAAGIVVLYYRTELWL